MVLGVWLGPVGFVVLGFWLLIDIGLNGRMAVRFALVLVLCVAVGLVRGSSVAQADLPAGATESTGADIRVIGFARPDVNGDTVRGEVVRYKVGETWQSGGGSAILVKLPPGMTVARSDELTVESWNLQSLDEVSPGYARYLESLGVSGSAWANAVTVANEGPRLFHWFADLRREVMIRLRDAIPGDAGALAAGIVTGDDSALSDGAQQDFLATGTSHITAVSGSNVAMVLAIWSVAFPFGRNRRRLLVQWGIVLSIVAYALFTGAEPPVIRAAIVAGVALFAGRVGRTPDIMTLLGLSAAILALANPHNVHLASYWLSIVASVAIAVRMPVSATGGAVRSVRGVLEGVVIAQVATVPLVLAWFGTWAPTSVVANVLMAPLMWAAFPLCFLLAVVAMTVPVLTAVFALLPTLVLEVSLRVVHVLADALPPVTVGAAGPAAYLAVVVPCLAIVALMARDSHRWWPILEDRWREQPLVTLVTVVAPIAGLVFGALVAVSLW